MIMSASGTTIFSQLMQHLPWHHFYRCVDRYRGNYKVKTFKCAKHFRLKTFYCRNAYSEPLRRSDRRFDGQGCGLLQ